MRELVEHPPPGELVLIDGVKVRTAEGWTLLLPDPEQPFTHVWAEAGTDADARHLARERADAVSKMLR
jgi:mannose-1-phosphate guanylyltransferase/phosphomannomutase